MNIKRKLKDWIVDVMLSEIVVGGNCGLCGKWVSDALVRASYHYTICSDCLAYGENDK